MRIVVLVGPKGSGKSYIGRSIVEQEVSSHNHHETVFLELEMIAKDFLNKIGGSAESWEQEAFRISFFDEVRHKIEEIANNRSSSKETSNPDGAILIFETTGAAPETKAFLEELRRIGPVHLVRVRSTAQTCAERIQSRDSSMQVDVPLEMIERMHAATDALDWSWDLELENETELSKEDIAEKVSKLWHAE